MLLLYFPNKFILFKFSDHKRIPPNFTEVVNHIHNQINPPLTQLLGLRLTWLLSAQCITVGLCQLPIL